MQKSNSIKKSTYRVGRDVEPFNTLILDWKLKLDYKEGNVQRESSSGGQRFTVVIDVAKKRSLQYNGHSKRKESFQWIHMESHIDMIGSLQNQNDADVHWN